jgi:hypothetical protein
MFTQQIPLGFAGGGAEPLIITGFSWSVGSSSVTITISGSEGATWNYSDSNISGPPSSGTIGAGGTSVLTGSFSRPTCSNQSTTISANISASGETTIAAGVPTTLSTSVSGTTGTVTLYSDGTAVVNGSLSSNTGTVNVNFTGNRSEITRTLVYISSGGGSGVQINGSGSAFLYVNSSSGSVSANLTATSSAANRFQVFIYIRPVNSTLPCYQTLVQYPLITYNVS